jgi:hypothetical protein
MKDVGNRCLFRSLLQLSIDHMVGKGSSAEGELLEMVTGLVDQAERKEVRH